jgi:hypothetical protein
MRRQAAPEGIAQRRCDVLDRQQPADPRAPFHLNPCSACRRTRGWSAWRASGRRCRALGAPTRSAARSPRRRWGGEGGRSGGLGFWPRDDWTCGLARHCWRGRAGRSGAGQGRAGQGRAGQEEAGAALGRRCCQALPLVGPQRCCALAARLPHAPSTTAAADGLASPPLQRGPAGRDAPRAVLLPVGHHAAPARFLSPRGHGAGQHRAAAPAAGEHPLQVRLMDGRRQVRRAGCQSVRRREGRARRSAPPSPSVLPRPHPCPYLTPHTPPPCTTRAPAQRPPSPPLPCTLLLSNSARTLLEAQAPGAGQPAPRRGSPPPHTPHPTPPPTHTTYPHPRALRDGNPNVTHETTRDVIVLARLEAVNYYFSAIERLMFDLSAWRCSPELKVRPFHAASRRRLGAAGGKGGGLLAGRLLAPLARGFPAPRPPPPRQPAPARCSSQQRG